MRGICRFRTLLLCACLAITAVQAAQAAGHSKEPDYRILWSTFAVSPDGSRIAYPVPAYDEYGDLMTQVWVSKSDGSGKTKIADMPGFRHIGWCGNSHLTGSWFDLDAVRIISLDGKQRRLSFTDSYYWVTPAVSPDGKCVAFTAVEKEPRQSGIFLLDVKTGAIKRLSKEVVKSSLAWSPDSTTLAYGEGGYQKDYKLKLLDIRTGAVTDSGRNGVGVQWSPDGKWLAYTGEVVHGGSWMNGVPGDGSIVKMNVETRETKTLTEPGTNDHNKGTGRWEESGALWPVWSPDGTKIAYRRVHRIEDKDKKTLDQSEIWVMNSDGGARRKLKDEWSQFVWTPDSSAILVKTETGIQRIAVSTGKSTSLIAWQPPGKPKPMPTRTIKGDGAEVSFSGVRPEYAKALLAVAAEARRVYADVFGFDTPAKVTLNIAKDENSKARLWTDGESQMFLSISSGADLAPPMQSGVFSIYGICHELGHMAMYRRINMIGLPEGVGEGWAYYTGSVVVDHVYKRLGEKLWPQPYNYAEVEGTARLAGNAADPERARSADVRCAAVFYKIQQRFGERKVMAAMKAALKNNPWGKDVMARFADAFAKVTGDESARAMIPEEFLSPKLRWNTSEREINDETTQGEAQVQDASGVLLRYDDGTGEGKWSTTGAGHAVMFCPPEGYWAVDSVRLYGSRYGGSQPPKENFLIFICDQDFNVIKSIERPYATFERGDPKWYTTSFDPVKVPRGFYVCVYFAPTATKGVYVYYDKDVRTVHSRSALPWTFVSDLEKGSKFDWMIRAHLVKAPDER